jgi:integrase
MPRPNKPWYWKARGEWCVKIDGKRRRLGPDKDEAFRKFHELMAKPREAIVVGSVAEIIEAFMDWVEANRPKSYEWYKKRIDRFYPLIRHLPITSLKPFHIQRELDKHDCTDAFKAGCVAAVKRPFNWAMEQGYIDRNPLRGLKKPKPNHREQILSQEEFDQAVAIIPNQNFNDLAHFVWYTGCRPQEAVIVAPRMYYRRLSRIVLPIVDSKGKTHHRIIYLCDEAKEIVERNLGNSPTIFVNTKGKPWTANAVCSTWNRIKKKLGTRYCTYALRHSYATHQLQNGTDPVTLATLLGHRDTTMLSKVYANLSQDPAYLRKQAARKNGDS